MAWLYLLIASLFEVGWPVGFKIAGLSEVKIWWILFSAIAMMFSGLFLYLAQKEIPIGTAYAIWSGTGTVFTFAVGILLFNDSIELLRLLGAIFIITGVILLKLSNT
ncbi:MAG: hypothetical protein J6N49_06925 [Alphaproteobacteria bacterium]|nr:hypothetical protein [Alphaproteobacteria bacterium]